MKIIIAVDSYKGCLSSKEIGGIIEHTIKSHLPQSETEVIQIADGGEGMLDVISAYTEAKSVNIVANNPCMKPIPTQYGIDINNRTAYIELAQTSGLALLKKEEKNPMKTTTFGCGEQIKDALEKGCTEFFIGLGGSATNDAGTGMMQALGYRFIDNDGNELKQGGEILEKIVHIDENHKHQMLKNAHFIAVCDVNNPFCGPDGAAHIYAKQKGADDRMIADLDRGMESYAQVLLKEKGIDIRHIPGSGAAGGTTGGMIALLQAEVKSGAKVLMDISKFHDKIKGASLIITGEGCMDKQSTMGKITGQILNEARKERIPVIAIVGDAKNENTLMNAGFKQIYKTKPADMTTEQAMHPHTARKNIEATTQKAIADFLLYL